SVVMFPLPVMLEPFSCHTTIWLVTLSRHRTSALPSPLKSPMPAMFHVGPGRTLTPPALRSLLLPMLVPFRNQAATSPVAESRQSKWTLPSPLKSAPPTMLQVGPGFTGTPPARMKSLERIVEPSSVHSASVPLVLRQSRSLLPLPSKSPDAAMLQ